MIKVLGARCLIKEDKQEEKKSGLIMPTRAKEPTFRGEVIAVGEGALLENGAIVPMSVKVGDRVVYTSFSGSPLDIDGEIFVVLNERDILAII